MNEYLNSRLYIKASCIYYSEKRLTKITKNLIFEIKKVFIKGTAE